VTQRLFQHVLLATCLSTSLLGDDQRDGAQESNAEDIAFLIESLGSPEIETRNRAHGKLLDHGLSALPQIDSARKSADRELAERAAALSRELEIRYSLSTFLREVFPGVEHTLQTEGDSAWTTTFMNLAKQLENVDPLSRQDLIEGLDCLFANALRGARGQVEQQDIMQVAKLYKLSSGVTAIVPLLDAKAKQVRQAAVQALACFRDKRAINPIRHLLEEPEECVRAEAVFALIEMGVEEARVDTALRAISNSRIEFIRVKANAYLAIRGDAEAVKEVQKTLHGGSLEMRIFVAEVLFLSCKNEMLELAKQIASDGDGAIRILGLKALGGCNSDGARGAILELLRDPEYRVRCAAIDVLIRHHSRQVLLDTLAPLLTDRSSSVRARAVRAVGLLGTVGGAMKCKPLIGDPAPIVRLEAIDALGRLEGKAAEKIIEGMLKDSRSEVSTRAAAWLCSFGRKEGVWVILKHRKNISALNALREPNTWKTLRSATVKSRVEGAVQDVLSRELSNIGIKWFLPYRHHDYMPGFQAWISIDPGVSLWDALESFLPGNSEVMLGDGVVRIVPEYEAFRDWRQWATEGGYREK